MRHHRPIAYPLPPTAELPTGNVHVLDAAESCVRPPTSKQSATAAGAEWVIRDGDGKPLKPALPTRTDALRQMGLLALRGVCLPLTLYAPDGVPTGDRLA